MKAAQTIIFSILWVLSSATMVRADHKPQTGKEPTLTTPSGSIVVSRLEVALPTPTITFSENGVTITLSKSINHCNISISNASLDVDYEFAVDLSGGSVTIPTKLPEGTYSITITNEGLEYLTEITL